MLLYTAKMSNNDIYSILVRSAQMIPEMKIYRFKKM